MNILSYITPKKKKKKKKKEKVQQVIPQKSLRLHKKANRIHLPFEEQ